MNSKKLLASLALCLLPLGSFTANASEDQPLSPLGVGIHLGFNLGGALPPTVPKPVEKVMHFNLGAAPNIGIDISYRLSRTSPFSLVTGIEYEGKGFYATVRAKDMPIRYQSSDFTEQRYSGLQSVDMSNRYLTIPLGLTFDMPRGGFCFYVGGYYSHALRRKFIAKLDGDGEIDGRPYQPGVILSFSLGEFIVRNDVGVRFGADYKIDSKWAVTGRVNVGLPKLFESSFQVMPYSLRNVFLNLGLSYRINR